LGEGEKSKKGSHNPLNARGSPFKRKGKGKRGGMAGF